MKRALVAAEDFHKADTREGREMARRVMWAAYRDWTHLWFPTMTAAELDAAATKYEAGIVEIYG
tara:strand:- start:1453 stop:1644 length:192 start_codon:yes stop_codon:yes gene_type:complete